MLVSMILDGKLAADIDQTTDHVHLNNSIESIVECKERYLGDLGAKLMEVSTSFGTRV